jgi:hypothetical protein
MFSWFKNRKKAPRTEFSDLVGSLLTLQLAIKYKSVKDAFGALMTQKEAAGYVFGVHDALLQRIGLVNQNNVSQGIKKIEESYKDIFGKQAGYALFSMSVASQDDSQFSKGRMDGGNELVEYMDRKTPPLGLANILILRQEAEMEPPQENPLDAFEKEIEDWPEEQARTALLLLKATVNGDQEQIEHLYPDLTVSQLKAVENVLRAMEGESKA